MEDEPSITEALKYNLASAACCSALLMEDDVQFTPLQYFTKLVGLSYTGKLLPVITYSNTPPKLPLGFHLRWNITKTQYVLV